MPPVKKSTTFPPKIDSLAEELAAELLQDYGDDLPLVLEWLSSVVEDPVAVKDVVKYRHPPVDVRTFVEDPAFLDKGGTLWPALMAELETMNSGKYTEVVLTGGIGTGKTTLALYSQAYQLYLLSCLRSPHLEFGMDPSSEITTIFQSINKNLAKDVDYSRFRDMISKSPYFETHFPFVATLEAEMRFPNRIVVKPVAGSDTAAIGQNVIGGIIDEINFMGVVEKSKRSHDGGVYNQAVRNYISIARRRESRFLRKGVLPGLLCLVSSRNYPGQFTDVKEEEARTNPRIYVYDKRVWDVRPPGSYSDERFRLYVGSASSKPRIMANDEPAPEGEDHLVLSVPVELRPAFDADILAAVRDIAGYSTFALNPYILDPEIVIRAFGVKPGILSREDCDFKTTTVQILSNNVADRSEPRAVHIDLGQTGDSAGVSCGYVSHFVEVARHDGARETLPVFKFDFCLEVKPPRGGEINFERIRQLLYALTKVGVPIRWVTLDTWQSVDTRQILASKGYLTGALSLDSDSEGYDLTKQAFQDSRIFLPAHDKCSREFIRLERDPVSKKVDHPPAFSKDVADSVAGVVLCLFKRREVWARHNKLAALHGRGG